jgi:drug/metabolite transporter (DMT)-like permease
MTIYLLAWLSSIAYGFEAVLTKLTIRHAVHNPWHLNFFLQLFMVLITVPLAMYYGAGFPIEWLFIIVGGACYALGGSLYVVAMKKLDASVLGSLYCFRTAMSVIFGYLFLNEVLTGTQYILIFIIFVAGIFVSIDERFSMKSFFSMGVLVALLDMVALVLWAACIKQSVPINGFWTTTLWIAILGQAWLLFTIPFFIKDLAKTKLKQYIPIFVTALAGGAGTILANAANAKNISIASTIISLPVSMIIAILFSVIAPELLEKHTHKVYAVRLTAAAVMTIAALYL